MTKTERRKLLVEIARAAERAYRRGFQQGFLVAQRQFAGQEPDSPIPTYGEVHDWRFNRPISKAIEPPGSLDAGARRSIVARLRCEINYETERLIQELLTEFDADFPEAI